MLKNYLCKASLYINVEKYKFYSELVEYLRYILFSFRLTMSDNKVKIIQDCPKLRKVKNIQYFLDFAAHLSSTTWILLFY